MGRSTWIGGVGTDQVVMRVEHRDGLHLRVVSGRRFGSLAYGSSLIGDVLRYPRSVRAARRIETAIGGERNAGPVLE